MIDYQFVRYKTDEYHQWQQRPDATGQRERWKQYLLDCGDGQSLLSHEMNCVKGLPKHPISNVTLVLLIGDSFEPLFQSIWAHEPTRLVPVLNTYYGNKGDIQSSVAQWENLYGLITLLPPEKKQKIINLDSLETIRPVPDDPKAVFEYLRRELKDDLSDPNTTVVIDITGAKKTMVAGALTLAAYTKALIYYIDPEEYNIKTKLPYGYSALFRLLVSPLDELALNDWEDIRRHYDAYRFADALQIVQKQRKALPDNPNDSLTKSICTFQTFLEICRNWENGCFPQAYQLASTLPEDWAKWTDLTPTTVFKLADYWPKTKDTDYSQDFFRDSQAVIVYAEDELQRAQRLAQAGDYRNAFTRAYSLYETLLKARVAILHKKNQIGLKQGGNDWVDFGNSENQSLYETMCSLMLNDLTWKICLLLRNPTYAKKGNTQVSFKGVSGKVQWRHSGSPAYLPQNLDLYADDNEELLQNRNKITHSYFPVRDTTFVDKILLLAQENLTNYRDDWVSEPIEMKIKAQINHTAVVIETTRFERPEWAIIKKACRLTFLPEQNREPEKEAE